MPVSHLAVVGEACLSPPLLGPADPATPPRGSCREGRHNTLGENEK